MPLTCLDINGPLGLYLTHWPGWCTPPRARLLAAVASPSDAVGWLTKKRALGSTTPGVTVLSLHKDVGKQLYEGVPSWASSVS